MISRQMVFDTRFVRNEHHVEFSMARFDRVFQLFQDSKSQFNALPISLGHDDIGLQLFLRLPQERFDQAVEAVMGKVPNAAVTLQVAKEVVNYAVSNMIVVQDQL